MLQKQRQRERQAFRAAFQGIVKVVAQERHMRFHLVAAVAVILFAWCLELSSLAWVAVIFAIALVLTAELLNSALEEVVDLVSPQRQAKAGYAKDAAAGAVLIASISAFFIGCIVFLPKLFG